ncbi:DNA polymerase alpha subunit B [Homalodisca vitripennis]|nr:DNA polymerase alpha subunit B [Homalodisca vitripennis]
MYKGTKNAGLFGKHLSTPVSQPNFSPASFSPILTTPSGKYSARTNAGEAVVDFVERTPGDWMGKERVALTIAPYRDEVLTTRCRIMMEPLSEKAAVLNDVIERVGSYLVEINELQEPTYNHSVSATEVVCVGRICCDSNDHLNPSSVLLEGSRDKCLGQSVLLDLSRLTHFTLFPGQVVAVVGVNPTGQRFIATKLYHSAPLPLPPVLPRFTGKCAALHTIIMVMYWTKFFLN